MGLLLALPLRRRQIFAAKYVAGLITILVFTTVSVFGVVPLASAYNIPSHLDILWNAWILTSLFMWTIYSLGLAVSAWMSQASRVYALVGALIMLTYTANIVALIDDQFSDFKYFSLFYYFDTQSVLTTGHIMSSSFLVFGATIVITTIIAAGRFNQRDISV